MWVLWGEFTSRFGFLHLTTMNYCVLFVLMALPKKEARFMASQLIVVRCRRPKRGWFGQYSMYTTLTFIGHIFRNFVLLSLILASNGKWKFLLVRSATVFAMVALPKRDSLHGLVTPCSQAQETKTRMMWQNCLTIPTIICYIFHNFVLLFLIWTSNGNIPKWKSLT